MDVTLSVSGLMACLLLTGCGGINKPTKLSLGTARDSPYSPWSIWGRGTALLCGPLRPLWLSNRILSDMASGRACLPSCREGFPSPKVNLLSLKAGLTW